MNSAGGLEQHGVALLATRLSVLGHNPCGGSEVVLWEDERIFQDAGIPVRVYGHATSNGARVHTIPIRMNLPLVSSLEYCGHFLRQEKHALLIAYNEPMVAGLAPRRAIVRFDWSTPLPRYWRLPGWLSRFRRALYLFPSESERQLFLQRHTLIPAEAAVTIPNGVDLELFKPSDRKSKQLRVGFAGQWAPEKGIGVLLKAWRLVRSDLPAAELWLAGGVQLWKGTNPPASERDAVASIQAMERESWLRIAGEHRRTEMPLFWNSVSVAAVPSLSESFGLAGLEAMACGVPVVASAVGGLREIVVDGECGLLVPPDDPQRLAQAVMALLTNEPLRRRLAEGARRRAELFSLERRSQELLNLLARRAHGAASR